MNNELVLNENFHQLNDEESMQVDGGVWGWVAAAGRVAVAVAAATPGGWVTIGVAATVFVGAAAIGYYVNK